MGPKQIRKNFQVIADCARHPRCSDRFEFSSGSERNQGQTIRSNRVVWSITSIFGNFTKFTRSERIITAVSFQFYGILHCCHD